MGLFHVWVKRYREYGSPYQRVVAFVNREAADEWWRKISTPPSCHAGNMKRISPQFYVQTGQTDICDLFLNGESPGTRHFSERMLLVSNLPGIFSPGEDTDYISGRWYFIRSKADPFSHWYLRTKGTCAVCGDTDCDAVHVSSEYRTRFCVRVRNVSEVPEDFVIIGSDEISIAAHRDHVLHINGEGEVKATKGYQGETDLLFSDLKQRFVVHAEKRVNGEVWEYVESVGRGEGEVWELVD